MALLKASDFEGVGFGDEVNVPTINMRYWARRNTKDYDQPVNLWDTAFGDKQVEIFDRKYTGLMLMNQMWRNRQSVMALGQDASITVLAVSWQKLLIFDSLDPYMTRLVAAYLPIIAGGVCVFVSKFTGEGETFGGALTRIGKRLKGNGEINSNFDLKKEKIPCLIFDWAYSSVDPSDRELDTSSHLSDNYVYNIQHWYGADPFENRSSGEDVRLEPDDREIYDDVL